MTALRLRSPTPTGRVRRVRVNREAGLGLSVRSQDALLEKLALAARLQRGARLHPLRAGSSSRPFISVWSSRAQRHLRSPGIQPARGAGSLRCSQTCMRYSLQPSPKTVSFSKEYISGRVK